MRIAYVHEIRVSEGDTQNIALKNSPDVEPEEFGMNIDAG